MWMLGYENGDQEFNFPADNSFNRKLRPLIPRANHQPPCLSRFSGADLFSLNNHFSAMGEQTRRTDLNLQQPVMMSSRWNPTPEQLRTLEELYRRGTRTPSADQIQHITAQLRRYGKIEGKNVFYWFQNHKARERLKRRRQMESAADDQHRDADISEKKDSGANKTMDEADEQNKNDWTVPSTIASASAKELVPIQTAAKGTVAGESRAGRQGWIQLERGHDPEFHLQQLMRRRSFMEKNATWQKMQQLPSNTPMSTRSAASHHVDHNKLFIPTHDHHEGGGGGGGGLINHVFLSAANHRNGNASSNFDQLRNVRGRGRRGESLTLELFPLTRDDDVEGGDDDGCQEKAVVNPSGMSGTNSFTNSYQYFEFLPLKN